jgi:tetratricopeptide (TPR) repeat protein
VSAETDDTAAGPRPSSRRSPRISFEAGDLVADRYKITRFLAVGGMGEVFAAEDTFLHAEIALKTLKPELAEDPRLLDRFKREIVLAKRVTHANVCRIFDLGFHPTTGDPVPFLTMELLEGRTLSQRVSGGGPLPVAEAAPIAAGIIAALEALHAAGIVHRDLKSGNVMLAPSRVVVTDFGLARGAEGDPFATGVDEDTTMMGSPAYMAPEQVEGGAIGPPTDVYSLGVVLYEMVTGQVPFAGDSAISVALKRLKEKPRPPRELDPSVPPVWEQAILRCLERDPADRFQTAADVARALAGEKIGRAAGQRWIFFAAAAALLLAGGGAGIAVAAHARAKKASHAAAAARESGRPSVAVVGFVNLARKDDLAWISTALAEMLTTELAGGGQLRALDGESVARMKTELKLDDAESYSKDTLARVRANLGSDYVIAGSYVPLGDEIRLDLRLQDARTGETILAASDTGPEAQLARLVERVGASLREKLDIGQLAPSEVALISTALPADPEAARDYAEGLAHVRIYDARAAKTQLQAAIAREPGFPQAHSALAEALDYLGDSAQALDEARKAVDLAGSLSREEQLKIEGLYATLTGDHDKAIAVYTELAGRFPDELEWGMRLANAQLAAGKNTEGQATIAGMRASPKFGEDPRIYMVLVQSALMDQRYDDLLDATDKLAARGEAQGALSLVANARGAEAIARWFKGDLDRALDAAREQKRLSASLGDKDGVAQAMITTGFIQVERGEMAAAKDSVTNALQVGEEAGRRNWLAEHVLGVASFYTGDLDAANKGFQDQLQSSITTDSQYGQALAYLGLAVTFQERGQLDMAKTLFDKLLAGFRLFAPKHNTAYLLHSLGRLQTETGDFNAAHATFDEAIQVRTAIGETIQLARTQIAVAELDLAEGKDGAAGEVDLALPVFERERLTDDQAVALSVRAEAELAANPDRAKADVARATELAKTTEQFLVRVAVGRARGLVLGDRAIVQALHAEAVQKTFAYEALMLAHLDAKLAGDPSRIAAVLKQAKDAGFTIR